MSRRKPFETIFGSNVAEKIQKLHESKGVTFLIQSNLDIAEFKESKEHPGHLGAVKLTDGSQWPVDLFLLAIGGKPATDFLKNSSIKLNVNNYVYVDKNMRTNVPDVYAAGDITYFHRSCLKGLEFTMNKTNTKLDHVSIGHWGVASLQGRFAALSILNEDTQLKSNRTEKEINIVPFFWSVHYNKSLRFAGYNEKFDKVLFFDDKTKQNEYKFAAFYFIKDKCVGVCSLDWDPLCALFAETLYSGIEVRKEHIEKDPLDIKKLLA